ncbi:MAG: putative maltokinase, partial [Planctomycetes bacterium]|nr:putative maltokinase [Planctomycetota bacterium]
GLGDNIYLGDRNGVRTPFQWSSEKNAGFSKANPQKLYQPVVVDPEYHYESVNASAQQANPQSLLWWLKRLISLRKRHRAFSRGALEFLSVENRKVLAFVRSWEDERLLVVANLSRFVQGAELDLSRWIGSSPVELFGRTELPPITERRYFLTLGPHAFYWFKLEPKASSRERIEVQPAAAPVLSVAESWEEVFQEPLRESLHRVLLAHVQRRPWFLGQRRRVSSVTIQDMLSVECGPSAVYAALLRAEHLEGDPETYFLPLAFAEEPRAGELQAKRPEAVVARIEGRSGAVAGTLHDGLANEELARVLVDAVGRHRRFRGPGVEIAGVPHGTHRASASEARDAQETVVWKAERANSAVVIGDRLVLKLFRRLEPGVHPEIELGRFLTDRGFTGAAPLLGWLEYRPAGREPLALGALQGYVPPEADGWSHTLDALGRFFERALRYHAEGRAPAAAGPSTLEAVRRDLPPAAQELLGTYVTTAQVLGRRTAEMHRALASVPEDPAFAPEPFTPFFQRSLFQSRRALASRALGVLEDEIAELSGPLAEEARRVVALREEILRRFRRCMDRRLTSLRIRCHGDFRLEQVICTGKDFIAIDFEGEPWRPLGERRLKRSALRDVAGMLLSFRHAAAASLEVGSLRPEDRTVLEPWADAWRDWVSVAYLKAYIEACADAPFLRLDPEELGCLLEAQILEKALSEIGDAPRRPRERLHVPLAAIQQALSSPPAGA